MGSMSSRPPCLVVKSRDASIFRGYRHCAIRRGSFVIVSYCYSSSVGSVFSSVGSLE